MVYRSFHLSHVQIPQLDRFLLFQTMRGAIDIVPGEIVRELEQFGGSQSSSLSEAEIETLKRRGYLTELSAEQEQEQARTILRVLSGNLPSLVELTFRFQHDSEHPSSTQDAADLVDHLFSLAKKIAGEQGNVLTHLDIPSAQIDARLMDGILDRAQADNSVVLPQLTIGGFEALAPWLKSENFRHAVLTTDRENMSLDAENVANDIINFFKQQVHPSWKCNINGMSAEQLEAMLSIFRRVRQKYPFFSLHLVSDNINAEATTDGLLTINGASLPFISMDNEAVLGTLMSFILMPSRINYKPFFAPDSHKLTYALTTEQVTYASATGKEWIEGFDRIRAHFAETPSLPAMNAGATAAPIEERAFCKYALVCGSSCGRSECSASDERLCAEIYERRLQQVLPLLLFNLQKSGEQAAAR